MNIKQLTYNEYERPIKKWPLSILLDNIASPENVGMIMRLADTLGAAEVILTGSTPTPPHRNIRRTAKGAYRYTTWRYFDTTHEAFIALKNEGYTSLALEITNNSKDIQSIDYQQFTKILLIVGAEDGGIDQSILQQVDHVIHIPTQGYCLSMNVATACAIAVYEILRKK
jgi:tRNA G18 (ribose-2'-O)-methylase SpoU